MKSKKGQLGIGMAPGIVLMVGLIFLLMATFAFVGEEYGDAFDTDTEATLGPRVLEWEHKIFPKAIELFYDKKLQIDGRIVRINGDVKL